MSASTVVVGPGAGAVIMVVTSRRVGVDVVVVVVVVCAEEVVGLEEEMMEEEVVTSEGCRTVGGVGGVGGVLLHRHRRRLGHLGGGMPRLTGDDHHFALEFYFSRSALFMLICFRLLCLSIIVEILRYFTCTVTIKW